MPEQVNPIQNKHVKKILTFTITALHNNVNSY
jgi:hypothetical protein